MTAEPGRQFIDGAWVTPATSAHILVVDPATEEVIAKVAAGGPEDVDRAVDAAIRASKDGWRTTSGATRAEILRTIAAGIEERLEPLAALETSDNGKPIAEARWDVGDAAACFRLYADLAEDLDGRAREEIALPDARFTSYVRREPVGVAGQIIPWNYPLLMAAWKVAPAIAAGATMVLKPSELTPLTALELAGIAAEAGLPPGVLNVVTGLGQEAGRALAGHAGIDKLAFTGSVPTGSAIMTAAAQDIKNVSLELGGKSPFIVFDDADIEAAVEWIMFGIFWNQGQVCSATSRLLVQQGIADRLLERLVEEAQRITIGNGHDSSVLLGPLVSAGHHEKVLGHIAKARSQGARLIAGGERPPELNRGYFIEPTIFDETPVEADLWQNEVFGPVLAVRRFATEDEAVRLANDSVFGLAAAVMSADDERCERVAHAVEAGVVWINCSQPTFAEAPWGGIKRSGIGRELGRWGLENYLEVKQVTRYASAERWGWYLKE